MSVSLFEGKENLEKKKKRLSASPVGKAQNEIKCQRQAIVSPLAFSGSWVELQEKTEPVLGKLSLRKTHSVFSTCFHRPFA